MLKRLKASDWLAIAGAASFVCFWGLALTGSLPVPKKQPQHAIRSHVTSNSPPESRQDVAAETVAFYTEVLAWFTALLAATAFVQGAFLYVANRNAERAFVASRRAFVYVPDIAPSWERNPETGVVWYGFRPRWANAGETQTRDMVCRVNAEYRDDFLPIGFDFAASHGPAMPHTLGPKSVSTGGLARSFSDAEMREIVAGRKFLFLWGWAEYSDIFPGTPRHISRYCAQVRAFGDPSNPEGGPTVFNIVFYVHLRGNCSDDECAAQGLGLPQV
jgi:hypothetical protein